MAYSKLHSSIVNSSLWGEPDHIRLLFITLLAMCDRDGVVYGSRLGIERAAMIVVEDGDPDPWEALMSPDRDSSDRLRSPEHEGRRIEEVPGGFKLLNFSYYRGLRNDDDRREQTRLAQERHRQKVREASKVSESKPSVSQDKPRSATVSPRKPISETEAEAETDNGLTDYPSAGAEAVSVFEHWQAVTGKQRAKLDPKRRKAVTSMLKTGYSVEDLKKAIDGCRASSFHRGENEQRRVYDSLTLICRDAEHVDMFMAFMEPSLATPNGNSAQRVGGPSEKALAKMRAIEIMVTGRIPDAGGRGGVVSGHDGADGQFPDTGRDGRDESRTVPGLPAGDSAIHDRPPVAPRGERGDPH